jgi:glutamate/tyrosine decarboxylase-like PLP-dependent enzyme
VTQALSIATFRFVPADLRARAAEPRVAEYLNELNKRVLERCQSGGEAFVSNAVIDGRYVLRACIVNFNTPARGRRGAARDHRAPRPRGRCRDARERGRA